MPAYKGILIFIPVFLIFFLPVHQILCDEVDDDKNLHFYWDASSGNVDHYRVYLSTNQDEYKLLGTTYSAPTQANPYLAIGNAEDGKTYQLKIETKYTDGVIGPISDPSALIWCKLRSPGDINGATVADADGNLRVGAGDWAILCASWNKNRGSDSFDYRADFNYDDIIDVLDLTIIGSYWGKVYGSASSAPSFIPFASSGNCRLKMAIPSKVKIGDELFIEIRVEGAEDIYSMDFELSYAPSIIEVSSIDEGTFFANTNRLNGQEFKDCDSISWIPGKINRERGEISSTLIAVPLGASMGKNGGGVIARIKLKAMSDGVSNISMKNIYAYDSKLRYISLKPVTSALSIGIPKNCLEQNYPNPFNPETWIPYSLADNCERVTIIIYDIVGNKIRNLDLGSKEAGFYMSKDRSAYWDGKNEDGERVSSGVYFYQIKAKNFSSVRKLVIAK